MKENLYSDMDEKAYRVAYLIAGFIRHTLTEKEHDELDDWVNESDHNMQLFEDLTDERNLAANLEWMDKIQTEQSYKALHAKGAFNPPVKRMLSRRVWVAAASIVIVAISIFTYRLITRKGETKNLIATTETTLLKPGGNRATLTLGNGKVIDLTYAKNGLIDTDSVSHVDKTGDGELVYANGSGVNSADVRHTLSTPVGGQYNVSLSDGTKVWLNAVSSIKYAPLFMGNERNVEITGEVYFEVAKDEKRPFTVLLPDNTSVRVTGTHFNVQAYTNEKEQKITLLEGAVSVTSLKSTAKLEPGTQAVITNNAIVKENVTDIEEVAGWKNGFFVFHDAPIETIMLQIERWYDAKVVYKGEIKQLFNANILRSEPLTKVLKLLELNGYVHFKIENKTIYVLP